MKHILFIIPSMEFGGTRSSLINLLYNLKDYKDYVVDLFIVNHEGDLMDQIPNWVTVLPEYRVISYALPNIRRRNPLTVIYHTFIAILNRCIGYKNTFNILCNISGCKLFKDKNKYDVVIAYQEGLSVLIGSQIKSTKHIIWIHSDIDKWYSKHTFERKAFNDANNIIFVAENTKKMFVNMFPEYECKTGVIKNTLNIDDIVKKSKIKINNIPHSNGLNLISIGRFTEAKAFDRIVFVCKELKNRKYKFQWTIVGNGKLYNEICKLAIDNEVDDVINFVGAQSNPFCYIENADVVVVSSINESQPMVILESLILSKPIVTTAFGSAKEILEDGKYGLICNNDINSLLVAIDSLFSDIKIMPKLLRCAQEYEYDNKMYIEKLLNLVG